jgi:hypothetical protein
VDPRFRLKEKVVHPSMGSCVISKVYAYSYPHPRIVCYDVVGEGGDTLTNEPEWRFCKDVYG